MTSSTPSLGGAWAQTCAPLPKKRKSQTTPFSIRLSDRQREKLEGIAKGKPLGVVMRSLVFEDDGSLRPQKVRPVNDPEALGRALGLLGQSRIANNLNQLAKAANSGALPVTPETCRELSEACEDVREMRALLMKALGSRKAGR